MACPEPAGCWGRGGSWDTSIREEGRWQGTACLPHTPRSPDEELRVRWGGGLWDGGGERDASQVLEAGDFIGGGTPRPKDWGSPLSFLSSPHPFSTVLPPTPPPQQTQKFWNPSPQQWGKPDVQRGGLASSKPRTLGIGGRLCVSSTRYPGPCTSFLCPPFLSHSLPILVGERQLRKSQIFMFIVISGPLISPSEGLRAG